MKLYDEIGLTTAGTLLLAIITFAIGWFLLK